MPWSAGCSTTTWSTRSPCLPIPWSSARAMRVEYPIAIDSDYGVWNAFTNHYWPALYLIDAEGRIRHHRFGEGDYDRSEVIIRQPLADAGVDDIGEDIAAVDPRGPEVQADWDSLETAETYLGYRETQSRLSRRHDVGRPSPVRAPEMLRRNHWALSGDWTIRGEAAVANEPKGWIAFRFHAPAPRHGSARSRASHRLPGDRRWRAAGWRTWSRRRRRRSGTLIEQRMYQLVRQPGPIVDRVFEIEFLDRGAEAFAFTFC